MPDEIPKISESLNRENVIDFLKKLLLIPPIQLTFANGGLLHPVAFVQVGVKAISHEEIEKLIKFIESNSTPNKG